MIHKELTAREQIVFRCLVEEGLSNKEMANRFGVDVPTIKGRIAQILLKTGCDSRLKVVIAHYQERLNSLSTR